MRVIVILTKSAIEDKILLCTLSPRYFYNSLQLILWTVILLPKTCYQATSFFLYYS